MKWFEVGFVVASFVISGSVAAQEAPQIAEGWRKVDGPTPSYVNAATFMRCPETLSDGYRLHRADVYSASSDVSCGYRLGSTNSSISFYFYPATGPVSDEFTSTSRPVLERLAPGVAPTQGQRTWSLGGANVAVQSLEVRDANGLGQSFAITNIGARRMKARETWEGAPDASHRVADSFFALQDAAIANSKNCAALVPWPEGRKARLSSDPLIASMTAVVVLGAFLKATPADTNQAPPTDCVFGSVGRSDRGSSLLLMRSGPSGVKIALDDQPPGNLIAGLASIDLGPDLRLPGDSRFVLYGQEGQTIYVYRLYKTLPNWEQIRSDMLLVATRELSAMVISAPKAGEEGNTMTLNADEVEKEKRKQRPGSR